MIVFEIRKHNCWLSDWKKRKWKYFVNGNKVGIYRFLAILDHPDYDDHKYRINGYNVRKINMKAQLTVEKNLTNYMKNIISIF